MAANEDAFRGDDAIQYHDFFRRRYMLHLEI